jgi:hypothetical protein
MGWNEWLRCLRHDLVKRVLWPARDRRDMGGPVQPGELVARLVDDAGNPASAEAIWAGLRAEAPAPAHAALATFETALKSALRAAEQDDVQGALVLEAAFEALAANLARGDH